MRAHPNLLGKGLDDATAEFVKRSLAQEAQKTRWAPSFWGRVEGLKGDYLIARCLNQRNLLEPSAYLFSINGGKSWERLPEVSEEEGVCEKLRGPFVGEPSYQYRVRVGGDAVEDGNDGGRGEEREEEPGEPGGDEEQEEQEKEAADGSVVESVTEAVRVAAFVKWVDWQCFVAPRGALILNEHGHAEPNMAFKGLAPSDVGNLANYYHVRPVSGTQASGAMRDRMNKSLDFLDSLDEDIPPGVWTVLKDGSQGIVVLSNLMFPGYSFWHEPAREAAHGAPLGAYGQYYFGTGERNIDLCFML